MSSPQKNSAKLQELFGDLNDHDVSKKIIKKLLQYNMKYEEITKVILSHSERAFLDARLTTLEEYYKELKNTKKNDLTQILSTYESCTLETV